MDIFTSFWNWPKVSSRGDLETHLKQIRENKKYVPEEMALNFFTQICLGLRELHNKNIIHRDLKLRNVLIFSGGIVR